MDFDETIFTPKSIVITYLSQLNPKVIMFNIQYVQCSIFNIPVSFFTHRSLFYVLNLIFPIALITLLTPLAFLLPSDSGERLSLAVTLMLASTVFMLIVADTTPESSDSVPIVTVYFIACMVTMFIVIVLLCYTSRLYNRKIFDRTMDAWTRRYIFERLSYFVRVRPDSPQQDQRRSGRTNTALELSIDAVKKASDHENKSRNVENKYSVGDSEYESFSGNCIVLLKKIVQTLNLTDADVAKELLAVIRKMEEHDKGRGGGGVQGGGDYTPEEEWQIVSSTLDRCLLFLFLFIIILITICCFGGTHYIT